MSIVQFRNSTAKQHSKNRLFPKLSKRFCRYQKSSKWIETPKEKIKKFFTTDAETWLYPKKNVVLVDEILLFSSNFSLTTGLFSFLSHVYICSCIKETKKEDKQTISLEDDAMIEQRRESRSRRLSNRYSVCDQKFSTTLTSRHSLLMGTSLSELWLVTRRSICGHNISSKSSGHFGYLPCQNKFLLWKIFH